LLCRLVEAARARAGPATHAVWSMGSPPERLLTVVERRIKHRVTGAAARTERRSLETPLATPTEAASTSRRGAATRRESQGTAAGNRMCQPRPVGLCQDIENTSQFRRAQADEQNATFAGRPAPVACRGAQAVPRGGPNGEDLPRDGLCQKLVLYVEEAASMHRAGWGAGALQTSKEHPDDNTGGSRSGKHPVAPDVVTGRVGSRQR